ncbi:hypothetical protein HDA32_003032 [Spinactinospora alkalitolerans]|uniref:3,4-dihydroxy-2-butanone-4-phosphate synthase n=1 Tax=Spinactinospora alkalitolerans TaxID=687207 RepID=A0A852TY58_9ACTN|nr:3,4-dihydroxy-2-butanone-4-phosphate synthase [Spinactinospora alkalitolerans]NYE47912.1 hypothetical protein [Spinactinospora alkalitolerans]
MVAANTESLRTAFLVSVDLKRGTTTGISAADRAATVRALADPRLAPADLARPGHVMPLRAVDGGVHERAGRTEAAVDLCRTAGLSGAALLCEVVTPDRRDMMRRPALDEFARRNGIGLEAVPTPHNRCYLTAKRDRLGAHAARARLNGGQDRHQPRRPGHPCPGDRMHRPPVREPTTKGCRPHGA